MNRIRKSAIAASLGGILALVSHAPLGAADAPAMVTLKPMAGPGVSAANRKFILSVTVGTKRAVGYFLNEGGLCKVTIMVGEAFNGEDVPDSTSVRFEVAINDGKTARMDTAEGKSLEFACHQNAQEMSVKAGNVLGGYLPGT